LVAAKWPRYAQQGRDGEGESILRAALTRLPNDAELHHALGLNLIRQRRAADALAQLARAATIDPANARYVFVYAIALNSAGRSDAAIEALEASHARHPADRDTLLALATINRDAGRIESAVKWARRLVALDPSARPLIDQLEKARRSQ
jgi:Flp pilus assembly protein TadD